MEGSILKLKDCGGNFIIFICSQTTPFIIKPTNLSALKTVYDEKVFLA